MAIQYYIQAPWTIFSRIKLGTTNVSGGTFILLRIHFAIELVCRSGVRDLRKFRIWFHSSLERGRWITCATMVWGLCIYFVKKVSCKNPSSRNWRKFGWFAHVTWLSTCGTSAGLEPTASLRVCLNQPILTTFLWLRSWIHHWGGGKIAWVAILYPPPTSGNSSFLPHSP